MSLEQFSVQDLLIELEKRKETPKKGNCLVVGTMGRYDGQPFIEVFKEVREAKDLNFLHNANLRSRMNPQRFYKGFYFKTSKEAFLKLKEDQNDNLINWLLETKSIQFFKF